MTISQPYHTVLLSENKTLELDNLWFQSIDIYGTMNILYELIVTMTTSINRVLIQLLFPYYIQLELILVLMFNMLITCSSKSNWYLFSCKPSPAWFGRDLFVINVQDGYPKLVLS